MTHQIRTQHAPGTTQHAPSTTGRTPRTTTPSATRALARRRALTLPASAGVLVLALTACSASSATTRDDGTTVLRYQGAVASVGYPELAEDLGYFEDVELEWVGDVTGGPASIQAAVTGETDYGNAFNGAIAKLASTGAGVTSVITYYGADDLTASHFYALEGSGVTGARDLIGKKVGVNTLGAQSETVLRDWLAHEGLSRDEIDEVELVVIPPVNAEQVLREGQVDAVSLGGVLQDTALERGGLTALFGEADLYGEFGYGSIIFRDDFIARNEDAVADFVQGTARAIRWAQTSPPEEVRERYVSILEERDRGETTDLVKYWKSTSIPTPGGVIQEDEISRWVEWLEDDGQIEPGSLDVPDLYTNEYNPYANGTYAPDAGPDGEEVTS
ncbi:ABC-type nitrate/sulfonate/bicarbonate transport system substrate-binding protein [Sediminihabitans luteus]|uniref:ABC-type nitrate/sulfonate/bicarbonate transport system substrate-binding protein n=1 Tax=Sediminihabitans luteus TaxID=1138585 RepID=A0A2M9D133_9CELL|nr:ABC transporter substrate-binding protein [Sediminihabitans luteus]PJJ77698.1 ABC-type nitrate/sulfonate/bicarbonate transport system substrate-binding protein [Sediminihabitans luteus]GIJ00075.1 ABC transporter substrate-binding protein [Sediminihabitans luteus]